MAAMEVQKEVQKAVQCACPGPKIGSKSQQIPRYSPICPRGQPPGMSADKCIMQAAMVKRIRGANLNELKFGGSPILPFLTQKILNASFQDSA